MKISIDFSRWRSTLEIVRSGPQLEEIRGLASVDRITGCVGRVQDFVSAGVSERFAEPRDYRMASRIAAREAFPDPGASNKRMESERGRLGHRQRWGLIRSGCEPGHCGRLRFSSKAQRPDKQTARGSHSRLGGVQQRRFGRPMRACPVGGPGGTRRLGTVPRTRRGMPNPPRSGTPPRWRGCRAACAAQRPVGLLVWYSAGRVRNRCRYDDTVGREPPERQIR